MRRLFVPKECIMGDRARLRGSQAHYLLHVLRLKTGGQFAAILPTGTQCVATIETVTEGELEVSLSSEQTVDANPRCDVRIRPALIKARKMDLVIQKCTELGASEIGPVVSERTITRPDSKQMAHKVERWQRIGMEAARQSGRSKPPRITEPVPFPQAAAEIRELGGTGIVLAPYCLEGVGPTHPLLLPSDQEPVSILIGPEGGFTPEEIVQAENAGLRVATLGPRILRAETAAITVCALLMYELGELT